MYPTCILFVYSHSCTAKMATPIRLRLLGRFLRLAAFPFLALSCAVLKPNALFIAPVRSCSGVALAVSTRLAKLPAILMASL